MSSGFGKIAAQIFLRDTFHHQIDYVFVADEYGFAIADDVSAQKSGVAVFLKKLGIGFLFEGEDRAKVSVFFIGEGEAIGDVAVEFFAYAKLKLGFYVVKNLALGYDEIVFAVALACQPFELCFDTVDIYTAGYECSCDERRKGDQ